MTALGALGQRGGVLEAVGLDEVEKWCRDVDRKASRDRQKAVRLVARKTLVPAVKAGARGADGKAGPMLAKAVSARNGKAGTVLVGPRGGKRGVWFRHIAIGGAAPHPIKRKGGAIYGRTGHLMYNPAAAFAASGTVTHPGIPGNPFVQRGTDAAMPAFLDGVASVLFSDDPEVK